MGKKKTKYGTRLQTAINSSKKVLLDSLQLFEVLFRSTTGCCLQVGGRGLLKPGESPVVWIVGGMWWLKSLEWP